MADTIQPPIRYRTYRFVSPKSGSQLEESGVVNNLKLHEGRGCGPVDGAVASDTRDPRFEPRHRQDYYFQNLLITVIVSRSENAKVNG